jgi:hypothetical protein
MQRSERHIEVVNGVQADIEAVGDISLELADGFTILLRDILYVPSLHRNLISVSHFDKDHYECYFDIESVPYGLIMLMWVLLCFTMSFICYPYVKKCILCVK